MGKRSHLLIDIDSHNRAVGLRAYQYRRSKITHINEETGHIGINGTVSRKKCTISSRAVFLENGRNLSRKDGSEGEASPPLI